jgi:hypothetical protein
MARLVAARIAYGAAIVAAALVTAEGAAKACENAVLLSGDTRIQMLHEAQAALDEGEVEHARELAWSARRGGAQLDLGETSSPDRLSMRADRILALAYVRDPEIDSEQWRFTLATLEERRRHGSPAPDPALDADYAEALSRIPGRHDEAYAVLEPLARKDLVGSPNALGALYRVAKERHDDPTADGAKARCEGMIGASPICRGDYPRPPLIRGTTRSYLPHALVALVALALRLVRSRRAARGGTLPDGRFARAPWIGHAAPLQALALLGGATYVLARATSPTWTALVFGLVVALTFTVERRAFFAAVRRGRIASLALRPSVPDDAHLPSLALYRNPPAAQTLEHEHAGDAQPGYREPARRPLLRVEHRRVPRPAGFALACAVAVVMLCVLLFGAFAFVRSAP